MKKCKWYNNSKAAVVLTIDDLSFGYMNIKSLGLNPQSDWAYGIKEKNSIFNYFEKFLLCKYPEIKYTVMLPFGIHSIAKVNTKYEKYGNDIFFSKDFTQLLQFIVNTGNEIAYHGHNHGKINSTIDSSSWCKEYEQYNYQNYKDIVAKDIQRIKNEIGIKVLGGRSPCYMYNKSVERIISEVGFKWWSFDYNPKQFKHTYKKDVLSFPTNLSGAYFNRKITSIKRVITALLEDQKRELYLENLLKNECLLSIAEHFLSTRPDGKRQQPNIFDDINSLDTIFGILRGNDIWYATCSEIAHYLESYDYTEINKIDKNKYKIKYNGRWGKPYLSVKSKNREIKNLNNDEMIEGVYKNGEWIFNNIGEGIYEKL